MKYYLAVDIGASSGRHIISCLKDGKIILEEIYRFENGMTTRKGHLVWDTNRLFSEILNGMKKCKELGKIPESMGIDTWGVDYALLDAEGNTLGELKEEIREQVGFNCHVVLPASHDTASAVMAVPAGKADDEDHGMYDNLYVSSGTWSLMGTEIPEAICSKESRL